MPSSTELISILIREMSPALVDFYKVERSRGNIEKMGAIQREYLTGANVVNMAQGLKLKVSKCPACAAKVQSATAFREQGRSTWNYLHSRAAFYPESPSPEDMRRYESAMMGAIQDFPCQECVDRALGYLNQHPLDFSSRSTLQKSVCLLHDSVNSELGKALHGCDEFDPHQE